MSRIPLIEKPQTFGRIDVDDLVEIGRLYDSNFHNLRRTFYPESKTSDWHHPALLSLANNLFQYAHDNLDILPNRVTFDIDIRSVNPGASQRDIEWHVDDPYNERHVSCAVLVSSALPTEFLIKGPGYAEYMSHQNEHPVVTARKMTIPPYVNARIEEGILSTYTPEPGEVVMITDHVHRSPYNKTNQTMDRVWMRGWLESLRGVDC